MDTEKLEKLLVTNETLLRVISSLVGKSHSNPNFISEQLSKFENKHKEVLLEIERVIDPTSSIPFSFAENFTDNLREKHLKDMKNNHWELLAFGEERKEKLHPFEEIFNELEKDGPLRERMGIEVSVVDLLERKEQKKITDQIQILEKAFEKADSNKG